MKNKFSKIALFFALNGVLLTSCSDKSDAADQKNEETEQTEVTTLDSKGLKGKYFGLTIDHNFLYFIDDKQLLESYEDGNFVYRPLVVFEKEVVGETSNEYCKWYCFSGIQDAFSGC